MILKPEEHEERRAAMQAAITKCLGDKARRDRAREARRTVLEQRAYTEEELQRIAKKETVVERPSGSGALAGGTA